MEPRVNSRTAVVCNFRSQMIYEATRVTVKVAAFYKFVSIDDPGALQGELRQVCLTHDIKGTILVASEGINATVSGAEKAVDSLIRTIVSDARFSGLEVKYSEAAEHPFQRLKVKIKREIVTFGVPDAKPSVASGTSIEPGDWNVVDLGPGRSRDPDRGTTTRFRSARSKARIIPRYGPSTNFPITCGVCSATTGNGRSRCSARAASAARRRVHFFSRKEFSNVYQLNGGILRYLEQVAPEESLWRGECFVFDERVALEHGVRQGHHALCARCGFPIRRGEGERADRFA